MEIETLVLTEEVEALSSWQFCNMNVAWPTLKSWRGVCAMFEKCVWIRMSHKPPDRSSAIQLKLKFSLNLQDLFAKIKHTQ